MSKSLIRAPKGALFIFGKEGAMESFYKEVDYYEYVMYDANNHKDAPCTRIKKRRSSPVLTALKSR